MQKIINGLRYNTENAVKIGSHDHGCYPGSGNFNDWSAALYKTPRSGRFFLAGEGGAMTMFGQNCGNNSRCGGEKLFAFTAQEALEWAEQYLDAEIIEKYFSDMIEEA